MDILKTPKEEREYLIGCFKQVFSDGSEYDEFTGQTVFKFVSENCLSVTVDDIEFKGLTENDKERYLKEIRSDDLSIDQLRLQYNLDSLGRGYGGSMSRREAISEMYEKKIEREERNAENSSWLSGRFICFGSTDGKCNYQLDISFVNRSHQRDMENFTVLLLTEDNKRFKLDSNNVKAIKHDYDGEFEDVFYDNVELMVPNDIAEQGFVDGAKLSVRFDRLDIRGTIDFGFKYPARIFNLLVNGDRVSDEEVDDLYDECAEEIDAKQKEIEAEKKAKEEEDRRFEEEHQRALIDFGLPQLTYKIQQLEINEFDTLEKLIKSPMKISAVKTLNQYCEEKQIECNLLEYIKNLSSHYKTDEILADIKRLRKLAKDIEEYKIYAKVMGWTTAVFIGVAFYWESARTIMLIVAGFFFVLGLIFGIKGRQELLYGPEATRFVENFPKYVDKNRKTFKFIKKK